MDGRTAVTGSLQHLGGERWRIRVYAGLDPTTGKQRARSRSFTAPNRRAAERLAPTITAQLLADIDHTRSQEAAHRGSVRELADDWLDLKRRQGRSPSTITGYQTIVTRITERFGHLQVADLTGRDIDRWYGELADLTTPDGQPALTASTVKHHHSVLRAMLRQAERWGLVDAVATRRASPPTSDTPEINPPTSAALGVVLAQTGGDFGNALRIIAGTGMRRGELLGLWWSDISTPRNIDGNHVADLTVRRSVLELAGGGLHIKVTKGRKPRTLTIGADVLAALAAQRTHLTDLAAVLEVRLPADGPVFADLRTDPTGGTPRRPGWLSHRWGKVRAQHGITSRLHDLRHWNATTLLDMGVPLPVVSERLGHAQTSTTLNIYGHAVARSDQAAATLLAGVLGQ
jgi:integrase